MKWLGKKTLGLGYAVALADLVLAPFTPSNTARSGGTIFPVIKNIPPLYGSEPGPTARKIGSYLMWTAFATTCLTSSMFLTGLAPNLLALSLVKTTAKIDISWTEWFMGMMPVGVLLFVFLPWIVYKIYPPELKSSPDVPIWAAEELKKMGRVNFKEISMALLALLALGLWIFGGDFINATTVALLVLSLMVMTRIVEWDDVLAHKQAWNVLVWFATLVTMADGLNKVGFLKWFAGGAAGALSGYSVMTIVIALTVVYFVVHYMFASLTAHTTALLPGASHCGDRRAGDAGQADLAAVLLHPRFDGHHLSVCHGPWPDLLRQRVCEPERFLEARFDLRRDLSNGAARDRRALSALLSRLALDRSAKEEPRGVDLARFFLAQPARRVFCTLLGIATSYSQSCKNRRSIARRALFFASILIAKAIRERLISRRWSMTHIIFEQYPDVAMEEVTNDG